MDKIKGVALILPKDENNEEIYGGENYPSLALLDLLESNKPEWRRAVIKSFVKDHVWKTEIENKLKRITTENAAIIGLLATLITIALTNMLFFG